LLPREGRGAAMSVTRVLDRIGLLWLPLALYAMFTLLPFYSMAVLSLHSGGSSTGAFTFLPFPLTWAHFDALINGAGFATYVRNVLQLLRPAIVAVASFAFVGAWNNFLFALFLINDQDLYTVPVGLSYFLGEYNVDFAALAAGGVIAVLPVVLVFALIQRYLV